MISSAPADIAYPSVAIRWTVSAELASYRPGTYPGFDSNPKFSCDDAYSATTTRGVERIARSSSRPYCTRLRGDGPFFEDMSAAAVGKPVKQRTPLPWMQRAGTASDAGTA